MADVLKSFLAEAGRKPFVWGELDCFLFPADWVHRVTGRDPAGEFRGAYTTAREARNIIKANGGPLQLVRDLMARVDCHETDNPKTGDVALVRVAYKKWHDKMIFVPVGAIFIRPNMLAVKSGNASSIALGNFPNIKMWTLGKVIF